MPNDIDRSQDGIFNARWLSPAEIARTFVAPPYFGRLAAASHTLLIGPRGSGKTTLLKMLQPAALNAWQSEEASAVRAVVNYSGVFIPADISWKEQVASVSHGLPKHIGHAFAHAAFTTSLLHSLVDTALWRSRQQGSAGAAFRGVKLPTEAEGSLVQYCAEKWRLPGGVPSLLGLKHRLRGRLLDLPVMAAQLGSRKLPEDSTIPDEYGFVYITAIESASLFVEMFDDAVGEQDAKWALLFDEMEIAPEWVQQVIFASTRSINPKLLLKIALSPYNASLQVARDGSAPSPLNDFEQIQLWYAHRDHEIQRGRQRGFCEALWKNTARTYGLATDNPYIALGESFALPDAFPETAQAANGERGAKRVPSAYSPKGKWGQRFISLAEKDKSFRQYLEDNRLSPDKLDSDALSEIDRARLVRKVTTLVAFRDFYRRPDSEGERSSIRSRKGAELYTGAETFFLLSEGHPRWLKVTLGRMLEGTEPQSRSIPRHKQGAQIAAFAHRFAALLKTFPSPTPGGPGPTSVWALVRSVGEYLHDLVVDAQFDPEPPLSFIVDSNTPDSVIALIQIGVNLGALVYVPDNDGEVLLSSVRGKRFRLSYWLAPIFKLPPTLGRPIALSTVLGNRPARGKRNLDLPLGLE